MKRGSALNLAGDGRFDSPGKLKVYQFIKQISLISFHQVSVLQPARITCRCSQLFYPILFVTLSNYIYVYNESTIKCISILFDAVFEQQKGGDCLCCPQKPGAML